MKLDVVYATDENYAMYTGVSICSLLVNNKQIDELNIHILDNNIHQESKKKLTSLVEGYGKKIIFHDVRAMFDELNSKIVMKNTQTITAYACCFMAYILDESIDKVLYMDGDSLIMGALSEICSIDMTDTYVCGSLDIAMPIVREKIGFEQEDYYINSGFLFMSLNNIRLANLNSSIIKYIEDVIPTTMHNDQDVINGVFHDHTKVLPLKYNVLTPLYEKKYSDIKKFYQLKCYYDEVEVEKSLNSPVFIHFTGSFTKRPWIKGCRHPLKDTWDYYKSLTEWKNIADKEDTRKLKRRLIDWLFNTFDIGVFGFLTKMAKRIKNIFSSM